MSSGELFVILLIISGSFGQGEYKEKWYNSGRDDKSCNMLIRDLKAEITSPGYPSGYPPFSDCRYTIYQSNEAICQVSIHFIDFDLEKSRNCSKDRLVIGDEFFCGPLQNYRINRNLTGELAMRFVSDSEKSGRGFRLSLEQIHCGNTLRYLGPPDRECCGREYAEPYFVLTSPGFLASDWTESNCRYTIHPSSGNVCRLRFIFKNFWVGEEDVFYGCVNGFLEIDKRRFCGCMDGYEYVSNLGENRRKEVWYSHSGPGNRGFVIEVFQEECPPFGNRTEFDDPNTEIEVFMTNITSEKAVSRFLIPRDGSRCQNWGTPQWTQSVVGFLRSAPCSSVTASQLYPFPEEPIPGGPGFPSPVIPPFLPPVPPLNFPPVYPPNPDKCEIFTDYTGIFTSPNYPSGYPLNFRRCYQFHAKPGHCTLRLKFLDFDVEKSFRCWKDYLLIGGKYRYCNNYFRGAQEWTSSVMDVLSVEDFAFNTLNVPAGFQTSGKLESSSTSAVSSIFMIILSKNFIIHRLNITKIWK